MPDLSPQLLSVAASRLADQVWVIRDTSLQAYLAGHAAGVERLDAQTRAQGRPYRRADGVVATFHVEGVIVPEAEWRGEVGSGMLAAQLTAALNDDDIKGGLLVINSPGGVARGMIELAEAAAAFAAEKPLVAHVTGCCCSAAYWLASQANAIYAGARDDVGSIGTRSLIYDFSKYFAELGVEAVVSATGPLKAIGVMGTEITEEQRAFLQERVDFVQQDFRAAVIAGRGFSDEEFGAVATGAYWFGEQALGVKLIDGLQSIQQSYAGVESAIRSSREENNDMADNATPEAAEPKPASTAELKKTFPKSTAEWREEQTEAGATMADAAVAYAQYQEQQAEQARQERDEAKAEAEKAAEQAHKPAERTEPAKSGRGASLPKGSPGEAADADTPTDFRAVARTLAKEKGITYREACRRVQREHGEEARRQFIHGVLPG